MTYPLSSDVSSGQPTAYQHYNYLRSDALRFGQAAADAVNLGAFLATYQAGLTIEYLDTNRLRVPATAAAPVSLMVSGHLLQAVANVDLSSGSVPSGSASLYYIFAVRSAGSTTFTLDINTSPTESSTTRLIGSFYWDGSAIVRNSIVVLLGSHYAELAGFIPPQICQGRLTITSGDPLVQAGTGGTVYFTPFCGNVIALYSQNGWRLHQFTELSVSLSGKAADKNLDVFCVAGATLALELVQWTNDTTRATALTYQDGVLVKSGDPTRRYIGTVRTSASGETADDATRRYVYNEYNQLPHQAAKGDTTSHTYTSATRRYWNNDSTLWVGICLGQPRAIMLSLDCQFKTSSGTAYNDVQLVQGEPATGSGQVCLNNLASTQIRAGQTSFTLLTAGFAKFTITEQSGAAVTISGSFIAGSFLAWM